MKIKSLTKISAIITIAMGLLTGCSQQEGDDIIVPIENGPSIAATLTADEIAIMPDVVNAQMEFVRAAILNDDTDGNIAFSPAGYQHIMSMVANGVDTNTAQEIIASLGVTDINMLNEINRKIFAALPEQHSATKFVTVNSLWYDNALTLNSSYVEKVSKFYQLETFRRDMSSDAVIGEINSWCASQTNNLIPSFFDEQPGDYSILNALYFKSPWINKFNKSNTQLQPFYGKNGKTFAHTMTIAEDAFINHTEPQNAVALKLLCGEKRFSVTFVMAPENTSLTDFVASDDFYKTANELEPLWINLYIPKFKLTPEKISLLDVAKRMGIQQLFNRGVSGIFTDTMPLSKIEQKTTIEINEDGAEAAAATGIGGVTANAPGMTIRIDRPFVVLIRDESTGIVLFAGKVENL